MSAPRAATPALTLVAALAATCAATGAIAALRPAVAVAQPVTQPVAMPAALRDAQGLAAAGNTKDALAAALTLAKDPSPAIAARGAMLAADLYAGMGRRADAVALIDKAMVANPDLGLRAKRGLLAQRAGDLVTARKIFSFFLAESDAGRIDLNDPRALLYLAEAARHLGEYQLANDALKEASKLDPDDVEIAVTWAEVFEQKYAAALAAQTLEQALARQPEHPVLLAAMAEATLAERYDLGAAYGYLERALRGNPTSERALLVQAGIEIDKNEWDAAQATIAAILKANAESLEALSLAATVAWLRDQTAAFDKYKRQVFALNPVYADFYRVIARSAEREHRYAAAVELLKEALTLVPGQAEIQADIGLGYLRLGDEAEGMKWLQTAWKGDPYNVRNFNTLELFDDTIKHQYVTRTSASFRFRYHRDEADVLGRYVEPTLERAFADMSKRYGFVPKTPVTIELYADKGDYSVRTVGLPDLGALGVCFGQVITAISPSTGDLNWGMVLWHELAHVFAVQLSKSRVPRWYTEGLSEYETLRARPEWRRENDADLYGALVDGTLPSVAELNHRFMQPSAQAVTVAYYLSAVTIEYIVNAYGFAKIVKGLTLFGEGKETPEVIAAITGRTVAQFDREFRAYLEKRLAPYRGTLVLPGREAELADVVAAAKAKPEDLRAQVKLVAAYYFAGDADQAETVAKAVLARDSANAVALFVLGEVAWAKEDAKTASQYFGKVVQAGTDGLLVRTRLGETARALGKVQEALAQFQAAKRFDPENSAPYQQLAEGYTKLGDKGRALAELGHYVMLEQMELAPLKTLVAGYAEQAAWDKVIQYGEMAIYVMPSDAEVLMTLGRAYQERGSAAKALYTYDSALLLRPPLRRPALAHLGRAKALRALGRVGDAKKAAAQAVRLEPDNVDAMELAR